MTTTKPSVLFVCVHNAGRSQMAAGYLRHLAGDRIEVRSAGSIPADQINPVAVDAMREEGIDITGESPKVLTTEAVQESDVVITMGCGDACPFFPGKRYEDWALLDPAGQGIDAVRPIRDDIKGRIEALIASLEREPDTSTTAETPSVLFVCKHNGGKSQIAAALMRHHAADTVQVWSAGTAPGDKLNALSEASVVEVGATMEGESPKTIDPELLRTVNRVIVLGNEAKVDPVQGMLGTIETWHIDEPSARGIEGEERMRLVRDDIDEKVRALATELTNQPV